MKKTETQQEKMNRIYKDYGLVKEDVYTDKRGFSLIKREGIEKIIAHKGIQMQIDLKVCNLGLPEHKDNVVVMASGKLGDTIIQDVGSANEMSCNKFQHKILCEMAVKRAKSRVVLQLCNLYSEGFKGEDEFDEVRPIGSPSINSISDEN